jgi:hypothetical protein
LLLTPLALGPPQLNFRDDAFHCDKLLGGHRFEVTRNLGIIGQCGTAAKTVQVAALAPWLQGRFDSAELL